MKIMSRITHPYVDANDFKKTLSKGLQTMYAE